MPTLITLLASQNHLKKAKELSILLNIPLAPSDSKVSSFSLIVDNQGLSVIDHRTPSQKPIRVDFESKTFFTRTKNLNNSRELLIQAIGKASSIIDATAGLGKDAFILASAGYLVTLLERTPLLYELLQDGFHRAASHAPIAPTLARMTLIKTDSQHYLSSLISEQYPDVIYLDPLFPIRQKSAKVKKEMVFIQAIAEKENDNNHLLEIALHRAKKRVVVKRHRLSTPLDNIQPSFSIAGKSTRFDIYLTVSAKS